MPISNFAITQKKIQDSFMEFYANREIHEITIQMICKKVGIARTTFYNYYSDIYELLETIEDEFINHLKSLNRTFELVNFQIYKEPFGQPFNYFYETLEFIRENGPYFRTFLNKNGQFIYKWKKIIKDDFRKKYKYEKISLTNMDLVLEMIVSGVIGSYTYWGNHLEEITISEVSEVLYKLCKDFIR